MQLPIEQYYELDPTMIWPLGGKRFALKVPRVNVRFPIWPFQLVCRSAAATLSVLTPMMMSHNRVIDAAVQCLGGASG